MQKKTIALFASLFSLSVSAFALPMAQRNCTPDDLNIGFNTSAQTQCSWLSQDDASLQVTLHANSDVPMINATCIFTPNAVKQGQQQDAIVDVVGHKAATVKNLVVKKNVINFVILNDNSDPNLNVIFYLNKQDQNYSAGNKILCSFSDA